MYIQNAVYKAVPTGSLEFPVAEGTIITAGDVTGIVPQNVALAPPTAMIYVATGGTIDLTSEANKGVSFTEAQIKELGSDFNFIPAQEGGGGSSLPPYTSADKGKVLTVGEGEAEVVIPAQNLTIDSEGNGTLTGVDFSMLSDGDNVPTNIVVGGETSSITGTYVSEGSYVYYNMPNTPVAVIVYSDGRVFSIVMAGASGDISASVPSVEPKWEANPVVPVADQVLQMIMDRLTNEIPKAITAGVGNLVYAPAIMTTALDTDKYDEAIKIIDKCIENGIVPMINISRTDLACPWGVTSATDAHAINGARFYYNYANYSFLVEVAVFFGHDGEHGKEVGIQTIVTLLAGSSSN